jgi:hypothetical protein
LYNLGAFLWIRACASLAAEESAHHEDPRLALPQAAIDGGLEASRQRQELEHDR